jgi:hypothetical protein
LHKKTFESFIRRNANNIEKAKKADEFIRKIRKQREEFEGRMFLIKKREEHVKTKRHSLQIIDTKEKSLEERKRKLGDIFENL